MAKFYTVPFTIEDLIGRLESAAEREYAEKASAFCVRICGKIIKMCYQTREQAEKAKEGFRKFLVSDRLEYTAEFKYWETDFSRFLPEDYVQGGQRMCSSPRGRVKIVMGYLLSCADYQKQIYYYCTDPGRHFIGAHEMVNPFYLWGMMNDMILAHAACVGVNGKGIVLSAEGGGGKSTLSVSCLMHGMDFVSDDYTMFSGSGRLTGMPVYSNIGLTPESFDMLKPPYPVHWIHESNGNKRFMDISGEPNFADEIEIRALVVPKLSKNGTGIRRIDTQPAVMAFHQSSMKQVLSMGNREYMLKFISRFRGLDAWELTLGPDVHYNAEFLREFIEKEL